MPARICQPTPEAIAVAADALRRGDVVGMPTETVYGLAGAAFDEAALSRIFQAKDRPTFDPLIVHIAPADDGRPLDLESLAERGLVDLTRLSNSAKQMLGALIARFWPGPLTLVLPRTARVPDLATSGLPTVAVRAPRHPVAQALIRAAGVPLAAPSANRFGRISPTSAQDVFDELGDRIEIILDGGACELGLESTVVAVSPEAGFQLLRPGGVGAGEIEAVLGQPLATPTRRIGVGEAGQSPGMLESHYAPRKAMWLLPSSYAQVADAIATDASPPLAKLRRTIEQLPAGAPLGVLLYKKPTDAPRELLGRPVIVESLSQAGDLAEAARRLFAGMRRLDRSDAQLLMAEPCPETAGLGHAIRDRLTRACHR